MEKSIEKIWKEGFLKEKSLVAPRVNELYNQKSKHLAEQVVSVLRVNFAIMIILAIVFPAVHAMLGLLWPGVAASILMLCVAWYINREIHGFRSLDHGLTSFEFLKSLDGWLKDVMLKYERIARVYYPVCFLIAVSTLWLAWNSQEGLIMRMRETYPDVPFILNVPIFVWVPVVFILLGLVYFSDRIYRWDVGLMYGGVFVKLREMIADMEKLMGGGES